MATWRISWSPARWIAPPMAWWRTATSSRTPSPCGSAPGCCSPPCMTARDAPASWSPAQRWLHWLTAGLVLVGFGLGWWMVAVPFRALLLKFALYQAHKTIGLVVLALVLVRLV